MITNNTLTFELVFEALSEFECKEKVVMQVFIL